jgi:hypothetical protein
MHLSLPSVYQLRAPLAYKGLSMKSYSWSITFVLLQL